MHTHPPARGVTPVSPPRLTESGKRSAYRGSDLFTCWEWGVGLRLSQVAQIPSSIERSRTETVRSKVLGRQIPFLTIPRPHSLQLSLPLHLFIHISCSLPPSLKWRRPLKQASSVNSTLFLITQENKMLHNRNTLVSDCVRPDEHR